MDNSSENTIVSTEHNDDDRNSTSSFHEPDITIMNKHYTSASLNTNVSDNNSGNVDYNKFDHSSSTIPEKNSSISNVSDVANVVT